MIAKWYISRKFHKAKLLWWEEYTCYVNQCIQVDKLTIESKTNLEKIIE